MIRPSIVVRLTERAVLILLAGALLGACAATAPPTQGPLFSTVQPTVTVPAGLPVVIALVGRFDGDVLIFLDRQIAAFEAANPDVMVELVQTPQSATQRRQDMAGYLQAHDTSIDVFVLDLPWLAEFAANDWLVPLDSHVQTGQLDPAQFLPALVEATTVDGRWLAVPWTANAGVLYYRRDLLERYGYGAPATWADVQRIALDVQAQEDVPYGFVWQGAAYEGLTCGALEFVWANGGELLGDDGQIIFDSPPARAALAQMVALISSGASPAEVAGYEEDEALAAFRRGDAVFMRNWVYAGPRLAAEDSAVAGKVGIAPLPASCLGGQALALSPYSLHSDAAIRFIAFLVAADSQISAACDAALAPALSQAYKHGDLAACGPWAELQAAIEVARPRPQLVPYTQVSQAIYEEANRMLAGQQDPATAAANAQRRAQAALQSGMLSPSQPARP